MVYIIDQGVLGMVIDRLGLEGHRSVKVVWYLDGIQYTAWLTEDEYIDYSELGE